ncbi:MAG: hypothetical protein OXQ29_23145 [Rhodospirillaceae bacterium]|nr:hypothetical protein [Rhodospirillaceae bacterium]
MSALEDQFALWLASSEGAGIPPYVREYRFHPTRKWRFDFAWPERRVAVEIEGIKYGDVGRHQHGAGFVADCEKYEAALRLGLQVYRIPGPWITTWRKEVIETLLLLLKEA